MDDFTELKMEHLLAMRSTCGLHLYGLLKINSEWIFDMGMINNMFNNYHNNLPDTMRTLILDMAVRDINTNTDLNIKYNICGDKIEFEMIE